MASDLRHTNNIAAFPRGQGVDVLVVVVVSVAGVSLQLQLIRHPPATKKRLIVEI